MQSTRGLIVTAQAQVVDTTSVTVGQNQNLTMDQVASIYPREERCDDRRAR
jgi:hypothetical protein